MLDLVRRLAEQGLGVVLISHNMADVFEVADRIATLHLGRMVAEVPAKDVTHGLMAKIEMPSFVVTLALFIAWQGVILPLIGDGGTLGLRDAVINAVADGNLSAMGSRLLFVVAAGEYAAVLLNRQVSRRTLGPVAQPTGLVLLKIGAVVLLAGVATYLLTRDRSPGVVRISGVPYVVPIVLVAGTYVLDRTRFGRHVYAVGGNREAAHQAGIDVTRIRASVFVIGSAFAAIVYSSKAGSVSPAAGGGNTLLFAVGAAVIGGTSLFGGRGRVSNAVIGGAVLATVNNGLGLLGQPAAMVPGQRPRAAGRCGGRAVTVPIGRRRPVTVPTSGTRPDDARRHNRSALLRRLHVDGRCTRATLAVELGLNRSTIKAVVDGLAESGVVTEAAPAQRNGAGRPSLLVLGRHSWNLHRTTRLPGEVITHIAESAELLREELAVTTLGVRVSAPGVVRRSDGFAHEAPNLSRREVALGARLAAVLQRTVQVANDAELGTLAEHVRGAARDASDLVYLSADVGVGGGVIAGGQPLRGTGGYVGELGHMIVRPGGRACFCGAQGC